MSISNNYIGAELAPQGETNQFEELFSIVKSLAILDNENEINLTPIAKTFQKRIDTWKKTNAEILDEIAISSVYAGNGNGILRQKQGGTGEQGTFTSNPDVFLEFLRYCSPRIAVKMTKIVTELFQRGKVELQPTKSKLDLLKESNQNLTLAIQEIEEKDRQLLLQAPKVELAENYLSNGANINLSTCAKVLRIKVSDLNKILYDKYIFDQRGNQVPYSEYVDWFYCKPYVASNGHRGTQLLVTPFGIERLSKITPKLPEICIKTLNNQIIKQLEMNY